MSATTTATATAPQKPLNYAQLWAQLIKARVADDWQEQSRLMGELHRRFGCTFAALRDLDLPEIPGLTSSTHAN